MSLTFQLMPDEPILIVTTDGELTVEGIQQIFAHSAEVQRTLGGILYRITDNRLLDTNAQDFINIVRLAQEAGKNSPGSSADPNIRAVLVADNRWSMLFREALARPQFGGVFLPMFETLEDALAYVRVQIANARQT